MKKQVIISFILGALIFSGITGVLAYKLGANQVSYIPEDSNWNVTDVDTALDDLYDMASYGNAQASDIKSGKTALVNGNQVTGSLTIPNYASLSGTTNINPGGSSTTLNGYYNMSNYKVSCNGCIGGGIRGSFTPSTSAFTEIDLGFAPKEIITWSPYATSASNGTVHIIDYNVLNGTYTRWTGGTGYSDVTSSYVNNIIVDGTVLKYKAKTGFAYLTQYIAM